MGLSLSTALAFAVTAVLTLTLRPLALRLGITDKPGGRKQHIGEIPLVGGSAMFIGILVAAMTAVQPTGLWTLLVPAALLVIVGVIDDRYNVGVSARLAAQIDAAVGDDAVQPGRELGAAVLPLAAMDPDLQERILHDVFGVGLAAQDSHREPKRAVDVPLHQLAERCFVA